MSALLSHIRAGSGFPLVLVHGYLGGAGQWQAEVERFASGHDVIALDLPGFGAAADRDGCDRIAGFADAIIALLDGLGLRQFDLLGHSMGGMIVQDLALRNPGRIRKLVLYGTGPLGLMPDRFARRAVPRTRRRQDGVPATSRRIGATWFVNGEACSAFPTVRHIGEQASLGAALAALDAMEHWDGRDSMAALTMPTRIIWGDHDRSYRWPQVQSLWQGLPNADLAVIPGASHAAHLEKPQIFHPVLADFLG